MTCRNARRLLSMQRECTEQERAVLEDHLVGCPACQSVAREYELMDRRLGRLPEPAFAAAVPLGTQAQNLTKERAMQGGSWSPGRWTMRGVALLVVVTLVAVAALVLSQRTSGPVASPAYGPAVGQSTAVLVVPTGLVADEGHNGREFVWPSEGRVSQPYSEDHQALDIANVIGTPVSAVAGGVVREAGQDDDSHGIYVVIDHDDGYESFYSHLSIAYVETGEKVTTGQEIGLMGSTGLSTGPHLHFEILVDGVPRDPFEVLGGDVETGKAISVPTTGAGVSELGDNATLYTWPVSGPVTQGYSSRHSALDIASLIGSPVHAAAGGAVKEVGQDAQHGIYIVLEHRDDYETFYSHLSTADVEAGELVRQGQEIGKVGNTGITTGPHLHFEILENGVSVDPGALLPGVE